jgi:phosphatidylserine/phosphatidylglycerophosphate/cardiolipin synthase-like enzyme
MGIKSYINPATIALVASGLFVMFCALGLYHTNKPLPVGMAFEGTSHEGRDIKFLKDLTYSDPTGQRHVRQEIFDNVMEIISQAREIVLVDMFLYNAYQGPTPERTRALSQELTDALLKKRSEGVRVVLITDPINTVYGGLRAAHLDSLRDSGAEVVITRLESLRDSNPIYSAIWRVFIQPFGNGDGTLMPNPFGEGRVSVRSWLRMLNFKANHRKTVVADNGAAQMVALVTSANPHDGSSAHGNIAIRFKGEAARDILNTELAVAAFSGYKVLVKLQWPEPLKEESKDGPRVRVVTESIIKRALLGALAKAGKGDQVDMAVFYLSDRDIVSALKSAKARGAKVRVLLDPNFDAFGHKKNGIPNRPVAGELRSSDIDLRWCDTNGEQCHAKMLLLKYIDGTSTLIAGSANYTRRNLDNLNLETNVEVRGKSGADVFTEANEYFELIWGNTAQERYSADYGKFSESSIRKRVMYRIQEATGLGTF